MPACLTPNLTTRQGFPSTARHRDHTTKVHCEQPFGLLPVGALNFNVEMNVT